MAPFLLMKPEPVSDYLTEYMTAMIIFLLKRTGAMTFGGVSLDFIGSLGLSESYNKPLFQEKSLD